MVPAPPRSWANPGALPSAPHSPMTNEIESHTLLRMQIPRGFGAYQRRGAAPTGTPRVAVSARRMGVAGASAGDAFRPDRSKPLMGRKLWGAGERAPERGRLVGGHRALRDAPGARRPCAARSGRGGPRAWRSAAARDGHP